MGCSSSKQTNADQQLNDQPNNANTPVETQQQETEVDNRVNTDNLESRQGGDVNRESPENTVFDDNEDDKHSVPEETEIEQHNNSIPEDTKVEHVKTTGRSTHSQTTNRSGKDEKWKQYHNDLRRKLLLERVRMADGAKDRERLEGTLVDCENNGDLVHHIDVIHAEYTLKTIVARDDLRAAMKEREIDKIQEEIEAIKQAGLFTELQQEVMEAQNTIYHIEREHQSHDTVLAMDRKTMSEIRRYQKPPKILHRILQAALLLLGEDELTTSKWSSCQKLMNPQSNSTENGMNKKVLNFNAEEVHSEIWARSRSILLEEEYDTRTGLPVTKKQKKEMDESDNEKYLRKYNLSIIQKVSPAAATFFIWTMGVIDACEESYDFSNGDPVPADIPKQLSILGRTDKYRKNPYISPKLRRKAAVDSQRHLEKEQTDNRYEIQEELSPRSLIGQSPPTPQNNPDPVID